MKKLKLFAIALIAYAGTLNAQDLPAPSPYAEVMQRVGLTDIELSYSRPGVKERTIFGGLEAYGEVWRTGANAATKITFSTPAKVGGVEVEKGTYSIFTIPGEKEWKLMLNSNTSATENSYNAEENVAEVSMMGMESDMTETMLFYFDNVKNESASLVFEWEKVKWEVKIEVESQKAAVENIKREIAAVENAYGLYNSSARYYLDAGLGAQQALEWAKKSVSISAKFWNVYTLSLAYEAMGDKKMAIESAKKSKKLAEEANYAPYVKMNEENIAKWSKK